MARLHPDFLSVSRGGTRPARCARRVFSDHTVMRSGAATLRERDISWIENSHGLVSGVSRRYQSPRTMARKIDWRSSCQKLPSRAPEDIETGQADIAVMGICREMCQHAAISDQGMEDESAIDRVRQGVTDIVRSQQVRITDPDFHLAIAPLGDEVGNGCGSVILGIV